MKQIIQNLIAAITGYLSNLTTTDKSNLVAAINEVKAASGGGSDTNFANTDLTATGDRVHDFAGHKLNLKGLSEFNLLPTISAGTVPFVANPLGFRDPPFFQNDMDGTNDGLFLNQYIDAPTISVILNIDGTNTSPIVFTRTLYSGFYLYMAPKQTGTTITCVSYTGNVIVSFDFTMPIDLSDIDFTTNYVYIEVDGKVKKAVFSENRFGIEDIAFTSDRLVDLVGNKLTLQGGDFKIIPDITKATALDMGVSGLSITSDTGGTGLNSLTTTTTGTSIVSSSSDATKSFGISCLGDGYDYSSINASDSSSIVMMLAEVGKITFKAYAVVGSTTPSTLAIFINKLPVFADEASAITGGLITDQVYKTSTGELRIKL